MGNVIEIKDKDSQGCLSVELKHILDLLAPEERQLSWAVLDLYATGDLGKGKSMPDFEQKIRQSPEGISISWDKLSINGTLLTKLNNNAMTMEI